MNAVDTPSASAATHCWRVQVQNLGRVRAISTTAPRRNRQPADAEGPMTAKTGLTSAADHWTMIAPPSTKPAPPSARRCDSSIRRLNE